jgi:hypothetical protein
MSFRFIRHTCYHQSTFSVSKIYNRATTMLSALTLQPLLAAAAAAAGCRRRMPPPDAAAWPPAPVCSLTVYATDAL